ATSDLLIADGAAMDTAIDSLATALSSMTTHVATAKAEIQAAAGQNVPAQRASGIETLGNATAPQNLQKAIAASFARAGIEWILPGKAFHAAGDVQTFFRKKLER